MAGKKKVSEEQAEKKEAYARQVRSNIEMMKKTFNDIDIDALEEKIIASEGISPEFGCFGSAGTFGCVTGCAGTAGTFGCAGFIEEDL